MESKKIFLTKGNVIHKEADIVPKVCINSTCCPHNFQKLLSALHIILTLARLSQTMCCDVFIILLIGPGRWVACLRAQSVVQTKFVYSAKRSSLFLNHMQILLFFLPWFCKIPMLTYG